MCSLHRRLDALLGRPVIRSWGFSRTTGFALWRVVARGGGGMQTCLEGIWQHGDGTAEVRKLWLHYRKKRMESTFSFFFSPHTHTHKHTYNTYSAYDIQYIICTIYISHTYIIHVIYIIYYNTCLIYCNTYFIQICMYIFSTDGGTG